MSAGQLHITVDQGATFILELQKTEDDEITPIDLTGCVIRMQVRASPGDATVLAEFGTVLPLTGIVLDGPNGTMTLTITDEISAAWTFANGVYDIEIAFPGGTVERLVQGKFLVDPEVTR